MSGPVDRQAIHAELELARGTFQTLMATASPAALGRRTTGTKWTNQQMLFHMLFGYLIVLRLLRLVGCFFDGSVTGTSSGFAQSQRRNPALSRRQLPRRSAAVRWVSAAPRLAANSLTAPPSAAPHRLSDDETDETPRGGMHFPVGWDPYFRTP